MAYYLDAFDFLDKVVPTVVSVVGLALSIAAYRKSNLVAKVQIPVPVIAAASVKWVSVVMPGETGRRFGITEIRTTQPIVRLYETVVSDETGNHPTYKALEGALPVKQMVLAPPITSVIFHHPIVIGSIVKVKVRSRGEDALSSWFDLPLF